VVGYHALRGPVRGDRLLRDAGLASAFIGLNLAGALRGSPPVVRRAAERLDFDEAGFVAQRSAGEAAAGSSLDRVAPCLASGRG
jgi:hypothetical protein